MTPQRLKALVGARRAARHDPRACPTMPRSATQCCAGWSRPVRSKQCRSRPTARSIAPTRTSRRPTSTPSNAKPRRAFQRRSARALTRSCSTGSPDRARPKSISKRSPSACGKDGQALVLLPEIALTEPFLKRFQARFGCVPVAWHSDLRSSQRRRAWRAIASGEAKVVGRRSLGAVPALPQSRPDRRRRGSRAELQAGGRRPVPRPRRRGDARASSRTCRSSCRRRPRRSRASRWSRSAAIAKSRSPTASPARRCPRSARIDMTQDPPPRGRWLAPSLVAELRGQPRSGRADRCCSSTAAALRR